MSLPETCGNNDGEVPSLLSIPPSAILFSICPYLDRFDLFSLRATCRHIHGAFHKEQESEDFWKLLLKRDFCLDSDESHAEDWRFTLKVVNPSLSSSGSIFGVDPWNDDIIVEARTAFDSWKGWLQVSLRFYQNKEVLAICSERRAEDPKFEQQLQSEDRRHCLVFAPFFLRAARFWKRIFNWCDVDEASAVPNFGRAMKSTLVGGENWTGRSHLLWNGTCQYKCGLDACYAVFAFNRGQRVPLHLTPMLGLMGGYSAYGCSSSVALSFKGDVIPEGVLPDTFGSGHATKVLVGFDALGTGTWSDFPRLFVVDSRTGALDCFVSQQSVEPAILPDNELGPEVDRSDDLLRWLEEHVRRLETREAWVEKVPFRNTVVGSITLYPQFPRDSPPVITEGIQPVSRAVSRGVEVIASSVYVPSSRRFGYIYSVRIRLLTPQDGDEYLSASQRGFETCQLVSRHWRITDSAAGTTHEVDGEGVIGMYPLLHEGGYEESGDRYDGVFQYQSCTGGAMEHGSFAGHMKFVPGSVEAPKGPHFNVEVGPFELKRRQFLY
ncbi:hypothetical protein ACA910_017690 [Epithemia clementina (nom. ined.)]